MSFVSFYCFHMSLSLNRDQTSLKTVLNLQFGATHYRPTLAFLKGVCTYKVIKILFLKSFYRNLICLQDHNLSIDVQ